MSQKFAKEVGGLSTVMPAKAGIQKHLIFLDSGSRQLQPEADPSFGGIASLPGMTIELCNELLGHHTSSGLLA
jgi:hypothetical protein